MKPFKDYHFANQWLESTVGDLKVKLKSRDRMKFWYVVLGKRRMNIREDHYNDFKDIIHEFDWFRASGLPIKDVSVVFHELFHLKELEVQGSFKETVKTIWAFVFPYYERPNELAASVFEQKVRDYNINQEDALAFLEAEYESINDMYKALVRL